MRNKIVFIRKKSTTKNCFDSFFFFFDFARVSISLVTDPIKKKKKYFTLFSQRVENDSMVDKDTCSQCASHKNKTKSFKHIYYYECDEFASDIHTHRNKHDALCL